MSDSYPKQFGKYLLTRRVAVGGMAEVFKAKLQGAMGFQKTMALKRILPEYSQDEEFVQMFVDEARISSNLHHKNIVQVFDFGEVGRQYYLTMELIDGPNLKNLFFRLLKNNQRIPREMVYYIIMKVAAALDYAHKVKMEGALEHLHLVHRDISPQNILISKTGDVKITDFGIAKATIKLSQTQPGKIQGKYSYMSPEQALGRPMNHQSDIFSLGIVFYELLTAKKVYGASETIKRYTEATKANIPRIGTILPDLPSQIENLITQMTAREIGDRPKDCAEVVETLSEFLGTISDDEMAEHLGMLVGEAFPEDPEASGPDRVPGQGKEHFRANRNLFIRFVEHRRNASPLARWSQNIAALVILISIAVFVPKLFPNQPGKAKPKASNSSSLTPPATGDVPPVTAPNSEALTLETELAQLNDELGIIQAEIKKSTQPKVAEVKAFGETIALPPPPKCPDDMVVIETGEFIIGSSDEERNNLVESPAHRQAIKKYCIDRFEYPNVKDAMPTTNVSWLEASQSCEDAGKRLCSEDEWERACKGPSSAFANQQYPYGPSFRDNVCNIKNFNSLTDDKNTDLAPSGTFNECRTVEGIYDLAGNAHEWTSSGGRLQTSGRYLLKGGSYMTPKFQSRCSFFREAPGPFKQSDTGFRCCKTFN